MAVLQTQRYDDILNDRAGQASRLGMSEEFVVKILEATHEESVRQQLEIMEKAGKNKS
jgi:chorismate mutase